MSCTEVRHGTDNICTSVSWKSWLTQWQDPEIRGWAADFSEFHLGSTFFSKSPLLYTRSKVFGHSLAGLNAWHICHHLPIGRKLLQTSRPQKNPLDPTPFRVFFPQHPTTSGFSTQHPHHNCVPNCVEWPPKPLQLLGRRTWCFGSHICLGSGSTYVVPPLRTGDYLQCFWTSPSLVFKANFNKTQQDAKNKRIWRRVGNNDVYYVHDSAPQCLQITNSIAWFQIFGATATKSPPIKRDGHFNRWCKLLLFSVLYYKNRYFPKPNQYILASAIPIYFSTQCL